jgi:hypothetical protein
MINLRRSTLIAMIVVSIFIGGLLSIGVLTAAGKTGTKYDYTRIGRAHSINGENGDIKYSDTLKKLLDDGWRIHIWAEAAGDIILEKER